MISEKKYLFHHVKADNSWELGFVLPRKSLFVRPPYQFSFESLIVGTDRAAGSPPSLFSPTIQLVRHQFFHSFGRVDLTCDCLGVDGCLGN